MVANAVEAWRNVRRSLLGITPPRDILYIDENAAPPSDRCLPGPCARCSANPSVLQTRLELHCTLKAFSCKMQLWSSVQNFCAELQCRRRNSQLHSSEGASLNEATNILA